MRQFKFSQLVVFVMMMLRGKAEWEINDFAAAIGMSGRILKRIEGFQSPLPLSALIMAEKILGCPIYRNAQILAEAIDGVYADMVGEQASHPHQPVIVPELALAINRAIMTGNVVGLNLDVIRVTPKLPRTATGKAMYVGAQYFPSLTACAKTFLISVDEVKYRIGSKLDIWQDWQYADPEPEPEKEMPEAIPHWQDD